MPFKSDKQRRYLYANKPEVARKLAYKQEGGLINDQRNANRILVQDPRWSALQDLSPAALGVFTGAEELVELPGLIYGIGRGIFTGDYSKGYDVDLTPEYLEKYTAEAKRLASEILTDHLGPQRGPDEAERLFANSEFVGSLLTPVPPVAAGAKVAGAAGKAGGLRRYGEATLENIRGGETSLIHAKPAGANINPPVGVVGSKAPGPDSGKVVPFRESPDVVKSSSDPIDFAQGPRRGESSGVYARELVPPPSPRVQSLRDLRNSLKNERDKFTKEELEILETIELDWTHNMVSGRPAVRQRGIPVSGPLAPTSKGVKADYKPFGSKIPEDYFDRLPDWYYRKLGKELPDRSQNYGKVEPGTTKVIPSQGEGLFGGKTGDTHIRSNLDSPIDESIPTRGEGPAPGDPRVQQKPVAQPPKPGETVPMAFVQEYMPFIHKAARDVPDELREEAIQDGVVALIEAIDTYKQGSNVQFLSYAHDKIRYAVLNRTGVSNAKKREAQIAAEKTTERLDSPIEIKGEADSATLHEIIPAASDKRIERIIEDVQKEGGPKLAKLAELLYDQQTIKLGPEKTSARYGKRETIPRLTNKQIMDELGVSRREFERMLDQLRELNWLFKQDERPIISRKAGKGVETWEKKAGAVPEAGRTVPDYSSMTTDEIISRLNQDSRGNATFRRSR